MDKIIFALTAVIAATSIISVMLYKILTVVKQKKYGNLDTNVILEYYCGKIYIYISKSVFLRKVHQELSYKLSIFNRQSFEKNGQYATLIIPAALLTVAVLSIVIIRLCLPLWYIALIYIALVCGGLIFAFLILTGFIMNSFLKAMPETLKILNSRFSSKRNISKAIGVSLPDFHKGIRGDMERIYDALKLNDIDRIKYVFGSIEQKYQNPHMTILLELIWVAYYNGGSQDISMQFDAMIQDVIQDIENKQDLKSAASGYIAMSMLFMLGIPLVRIYNAGILDATQMAYYSSREGMIFAGIYLLVSSLVIAVLFYTERTGV